MTRICKKCNETKPLNTFPVYNREKGYRRHECKECNTERVESHHQANKVERLQKARERYQENPLAVWTPERRQRAKELDRVRYMRIKNKVFDLYGDECRACGERERLFLTIDHINNDGWKLRKENGYREFGIGLYIDILRNGMRDDLEVLCYNCNFGKRQNGGILVKDRRVEGRRNDQGETPYSQAAGSARLRESG